MGKELSKAIMKRSMFKTNYQKNPTPDNRKKYSKQRNTCVSIRRNAIRNYFNQVTTNGGSMGNKKFYDIFKPYLTNKGALVTNDISIVKDGKVITESLEIAEMFNKYYANIFENATGKKPINIKNQLPVDVTNNEVFCNIVEAYINHPSILAIKENFPCQDVFSFKEVSEKEIFNNLNNLDTKKSTGDDNISSKFLKLSASILNRPLTFTVNASIKDLNFPTKAKRAAVTAIYKSDDKTDVKNYRPISILNSLSKIFENVIKNQIVPFFDKCWSKYLSAYRKSHSCQHVLIRMMENLRKSLDQSKLVGVILMDLSKAFDCISHDLLIAKLNAYGLSENAILYIYSYLKERQQCVKINNIDSQYEFILSGVPQGSILGPILFNIFINDLFVFIKTANIHNYADDNSLEAAANTVEELIAILEGESNIAIDWLEINEMIPNAKKFQALILAKNKVGPFNDIQVTIKGKTILSKSSVNFLGINIDNELKFDEHVRSLCNKGGRQLNALFRLNRYLNFESKKILVNSFIYSNFNYCPLIWHFTSANSIKMIEKVQERLLRFLYNDLYSSYDDLLRLDGKTTMLVSRLKTLCIEVYKTINFENPSYMNSIFKKSNYRSSLRFPNNIEVPQVMQVTYGSKSLRALGPKIWNGLTEEIKSSETLEIFKRNIKNWGGPNCECNMCKFISSDD